MAVRVATGGVLTGVSATTPVRLPPGRGPWRLANLPSARDPRPSLTLLTFAG
ncbi:hypothetical protein [Actinophytocola gossypii]|uniref:Uncharacterized protein n=1 Tax=Actinophytocola gossypii TaxID=2812003 RepID=A0ABT2J8V9_9PSEU|nr:hypothetical protein [Actinophytocola gossypii]MCT2584141.1 hypothetical protein [Actinophytocola gossypii]